MFPLPLLPCLELCPLGGAGNSPANPLGQPGYWQFDTPIRLYTVVKGTETATALRQRRYGHGFTETVTKKDTDERKRSSNAGNQALVYT